MQNEADNNSILNKDLDENMIKLNEMEKELEIQKNVNLSQYKEIVNL